MNDLELWRKKNLSYYQDIEKTHQFFIPPNSDVLAIGTGLGDLLNAVKPRIGHGIDINKEAIEAAKKNILIFNFS